uniref:C2H2-type domain-containing protein n=1 Tax=Timema tahoe TaxID=61484 RepID=A0A7R9FHZ9_9NEOP|nr:unnamed protein product [Timema tahoe]
MIDRGLIKRGDIGHLIADLQGFSKSTVLKYWKKNPEEVATPQKKRKKKLTPRVSVEAIYDFDQGVVRRRDDSTSGEEPNVADFVQVEIKQDHELSLGNKVSTKPPARRIETRSTKGAAENKCLNSDSNIEESQAQTPVNTRTQPTPTSGAQQSNVNSYYVPSCIEAVYYEPGGPIKEYKCPSCSKYFRHRSNLNQHIQIHSGEHNVFKCPHCFKGFSRRKHMIEHTVTHGGEKMFDYKCPECNKSFNNRSNLRRHRLIHSGDKPFKCHDCGKAFNRSSHLKEHKFVHTGEERPFECPLCGRGFYNRSSLKVHMITHTDYRPFSCDKCTKCFHRKSELNRHVITHTGLKLYNCGECQKSFTDKSYLNKHIMLKHCEDKPLSFDCPVCKKTYNDSSYIKKHILTHTGGDKAFKCVECGKGFRDSYHLKRHSRKHLVDTLQETI